MILKDFEFHYDGSIFFLFFIFYFLFFISNKDLLKKRERYPSTQGVYRGEHIKSEHYINQVNPK